MAERLRVCYLGAYDREHVRNSVIIEGLRQAGVEVIEIHELIWRDTAERVSSASRGVLQPRLWYRLARAHAALAWRYIKSSRHDLVIVGHPGHPELLLARLLAWARRKPLVFDALTSLYETVVEDRALFPAASLHARLLLHAEKLLYRLPDRILVDTDTQAELIRARYRVAPERLRRIWVGAPDGLSSEDRIPRPAGAGFRVVYFGKFIPLHGLEQVLQAAHLLSDQTDIRFELMGSGQTYAQMRQMAQELGLENVSFLPEWLPLDVLAQRVASADACLGVFGTAPKTQRVIPTKAYLALALGLPLITNDSPGIRELLVPNEHALLCEPGDPQSLATAILRLRDDPQLAARLTRQGRALYEAHATPAAVAAQVQAVAAELTTPA
jgi:glycosyltransferase involved in cell wall biosynthesis